MPEDAAARLVEHEVAKRLVARDETALLPDRVAGRRRDAADDHVADLAFGMAAHDMNCLRRAHEIPSAATGTTAAYCGSRNRHKPW